MARLSALAVLALESVELTIVARSLGAGTVLVAVTTAAGLKHVNPKVGHAMSNKKTSITARAANTKMARRTIRNILLYTYLIFVARHLELVFS